jgi:hypothetical protein
MPFEVWQLDNKTNKLKCLRSFLRITPAYKYAEKRVLAKGHEFHKLFVGRHLSYPILEGIGDRVKVGWNTRFTYWVKWAAGYDL